MDDTLEKKFVENDAEESDADRYNQQHDPKIDFQSIRNEYARNRSHHVKRTVRDVDYPH